MKHVFIVIIIAINFFNVQSLYAQQRRLDFFEEGPRAHSVYVEAGGPGLLSINYDTRFAKTRNGLGIRGGIGYMKFDGDGLTTIPVQLNYLLGKNGHYFEVGAGATFVNQTSEYYYNGTYYYYYPMQGLQRETSNHIMGTLLFGYRRQPVNGGFNFRAGLSPIIFQRNFIPYLPHVSFGYSF